MTNVSSWFYMILQDKLYVVDEEHKLIEKDLDDGEEKEIAFVVDDYFVINDDVIVYVEVGYDYKIVKIDKKTGQKKY